MHPMLYLVLLATLVSPALAEKPKKTAPPGKWTVDDLVLLETARDFQLSPDGKQLLWVRSVMNEEVGTRVSHVFRTSLADRKDTQLTRGSESCLLPRWSPDGKLLAFVSKRASSEPKAKRGKGRAPKGEDPTEQLWLMDPTGGEPWQLTDRTRKVVAYNWAGSGLIVFLAQEDPTLHEKSTKDDKKDTSTVVEDEKHEPPVRLFQVDVESKKVLRLTDNKDRILSLAVSPDGKKAVAVHGQSLSYEYDHKVKPIAYLYDLESSQRKPLFKDAARNVSAARWTPDGKGIYVSTLFTTSPRYVHATITDLYFVDAATGQEGKVDLAWERGLAEQADNDYKEGFTPTKDGFLALLADGVRTRLARYTRAGESWKRDWLTGDHAGNIFALTASDDGKTAVYCHSKCSRLPQWYVARIEGNSLQKPESVAKINEGARNLTLARVEVIRWKGALNEEIEGLLYYPHNHERGKKYPLVVMIHGGPFGADFDSWDDSWAYPANLVCQRGAFVFKPNYHGSSSYGLKFAESIAGGGAKYYDLPLQDIESGVDFLIGAGLVDPAKLATMGWSNGAILSAALIVKTQRYRAASLGAGGAEWVADWGACEFGLTFSNYYFGKSPLEDPELYRQVAPLYKFDRVRTPTIIFHGEADKAVPTHHAWAQFRTLQQLGKAPVRLLLFPDEPHSLEKLVHQRRKATEDLAWLDKHLFASLKEENVALKSGSPLERALKLQGVKRDGARYGIRLQGVLAPETVEFQGLQVGRFEVTQAQYAEFDRNFKVEPGKENYPMTGITFAKAAEYCRWLSDKTGDAYRLPNDDEGQKLYADREGDGENVLDWWAGYTLNPDDAGRLLAKIKELGGNAPLLREVGRFKGAGKDEPVFDLGGNAAEWVEVEKGKGKPSGGCASCLADTKRIPKNPPAEYVGFRAVKGKK